MSGRLIYEKFTEDPKEKPVERTLSGQTTSIVAGTVHAVAERIATGTSCELGIMQKSFLGGGFETYIDAVDSKLLEKNREYADGRIEELEKSEL